MATILYGTKKGIREIVLTFDDGPSLQLTPKLLDILATRQIKAMFFVVGQQMKTAAGRNLMERAHSEGHLIGNHSYTHADFKTLSEKKVREELRKTQDLIGPAAHELKFFRPPYGSTNGMVDKILKSEGYTKVLWNVDTLDWHPKFRKNGLWVGHGMIQINNREDSIVLMHDIHATTVNRVEDLITRIKKIPKVEFAIYAD